MNESLTIGTRLSRTIEYVVESVRNMRRYMGINGEANMNQTWIKVEIRRDDDGLFMATSPTLTGVFVAHRDSDKIVEDMPNIIRLWFKRNRNEVVEVFQGPAKQAGDTIIVQALPIRPEIAAMHL